VFSSKVSLKTNFIGFLGYIQNKIIFTFRQPKIESGRITYSYQIPEFFNTREDGFDMLSEDIRPARKYQSSIRNEN